MKKIIDDYSPILENVPFQEIKEQVLSESEKKESQSKSQEDSLHLDDTTSGKDVPVGE